MNGRKIGFLCSSRNSFIQMFGQAFSGVYLFGIFMKLVNNVSQQAVSVGKYAVSHVSSKLLLRSGEVQEILLKNSRFIW